MKKYRVAVVGATGNVGRMVMEYLVDRNFPIESIDAYASLDSAGREVSFGDEDTLKVLPTSKIDFNKLDLAFLCAGSKVSEELVKKAEGTNCIIIDKASIFRLNKDVPLIVPEANIKDLDNSKSKIIANPNCCVIPLCVALKPLDNAAKIKRVVISTYQSVSGAGNKGLDELYNQTKAKFSFDSLPPEVFPEQIAFNLMPHIGKFLEDGSTEEEYKISKELEKIIGMHIESTVTCVRVPVFVGHSMSVNVEFEKNLSAEEAYEILSEADGIMVNSHDNEVKYVTPVDVTEADEVFVSRIRPDNTRENSINLWVSCDNLRKGAALNAIQIAEHVLGVTINSDK